MEKARQHPFIDVLDELEPGGLQTFTRSNIHAFAMRLSKSGSRSIRQMTGRAGRCRKRRGKFRRICSPAIASAPGDSWIAKPRTSSQNAWCVRRNAAAASSIGREITPLYGEAAAAISARPVNSKFSTLRRGGGICGRYGASRHRRTMGTFQPGRHTISG